MKKIFTLLGIFAAFLMQFVSSSTQAASTINAGKKGISSYTIQHGLPNAVIFRSDDSSDDASSDGSSSDDDSSDDEVPIPPTEPTGGGGV
jgi:hypothetical protein